MFIPMTETENIIVIDSLENRINQEHRLFKNYATKGLEHAINCGWLLIEKKEEMPAGRWMPWVRENCEFSVDLADKYMRVARNSERVMNWARMKPLSLREACRRLVKKRKEGKPAGVSFFKKTYRVAWPELRRVHIAIEHSKKILDRPKKGEPAPIPEEQARAKYFLKSYRTWLQYELKKIDKAIGEHKQPND